MKLLFSLLFSQILFSQTFEIQHVQEEILAENVKQYLSTKYNIPNDWVRIKKTTKCSRNENKTFAQLCIENAKVSILDRNLKKIETLKILRN